MWSNRWSWNDLVCITLKCASLINWYSSSCFEFLLKARELFLYSLSGRLLVSVPASKMAAVLHGNSPNLFSIFPLYDVMRSIRRSTSCDWIFNYWVPSINNYVLITLVSRGRCIPIVPGMITKQPPSSPLRYVCCFWQGGIHLAVVAIANATSFWFAGTLSRIENRTWFLDHGPQRCNLVSPYLYSYSGSSV